MERFENRLSVERKNKSLVLAILYIILAILVIIGISKLEFKIQFLLMFFGCCLLLFTVANMMLTLVLRRYNKRLDLFNQYPSYIEFHSEYFILKYLKNSLGIEPYYVSCKIYYDELLRTAIYKRRFIITVNYKKYKKSVIQSRYENNTIHELSWAGFDPRLKEALLGRYRDVMKVIN